MNISITLLILTAFITYIIYTVGKIKELNSNIIKVSSENKKLLSQKKSSEVRLGKIGENMAPFFTEWPYDPNDFRFLGNPVDGIQFNEDGIIFVEIKTGKARLTNSQKSVKQLVKEGKIKFATFRVGEEGCSLQVEEVVDFKELGNDTLIEMT